MAIKNIQLKNMTGDELLPKTSGALVWNGTGDNAYNLSTVEEGAQVNVLEGVQLNGTDITIDANKKANIVLPAAAEYTIAKDATAASGYSATYHLTKDGTNVGEAINIPKDMVVESGSVKTCVEADVPVEGYEVGDKYIDLVIANKDSSHLYILVSDLIDVYTGSTYINVANNEISLKYNDLETKLQDTFYTESEIDAKDALAVHLAGAESITGVKTFSASPLVPTAAGTSNDTTAASTAFVKTAIADADIVHLAGAETITGNKTFSGDLIATTQAAGDNSTKVATTAFVKNAVDTADATAVHLAGEETITGDKTFSGNVVVPTQADGDSSTKAASTAFVATAISNAEAGIVHTTGDESVAGVKTFTGSIAATAATVTVADQTQGDNSSKAANTKYVDAAATALDTAKANKATTLAGYGITDSIVYEEII